MGAWRGMMGDKGEIALVVRIAFVLSLGCLAVWPQADAAETPDLVYSVDFSGFPGGSVLAWLGARGFAAKQDAGNAGRIALSVVDRALVLEAKRRALGLLINETDVASATRIRIEWGVNAFPPGADYDKGLRSEAIMIHVFFGKDKVSSGSLLVPNSPYFIGLFLCQVGRIDHPYTGRYFKAGGRYVCLRHPSLDELLVSEFDLAQAFKSYFGSADVPTISGFTIAIDTENATGKATAKSFVRRIEFLKCQSGCEPP
jgi:hypothetical protein